MEILTKLFPKRLVSATIIAYNENHMNRRILWNFLAAVLILSITFGGWKDSFAQTNTELYYPETGHRVTGVFLDYYQKASDPLLVYGYPFTEAFRDPVSGVMVQYFQRARFEFHPDAPDQLWVQLTPIGEYLYTYSKGNPLPIPDKAGCQFFSETGYYVCQAFLNFFQKNGGVAQFGYPISGFEARDERIVQYFQRARFEWHPERPSGQRVTLTNLGSMYFDVRNEDRRRLRPVQDNTINSAVLNLKARAFVRQSVTGMHGNQSLFVVVQDQNRQPLADADVAVEISFPTGEVGRYDLNPTDSNGLTSFNFPFIAEKRGMVVMNVQVAYQGLETSTVTSYRIWW